MLRVLFVEILPFFAPLAFYVTWVWLRGRWVERHGGEAPAVEKGILFWLTVFALVAVFLSLMVGALLQDEGKPGETYRPPRLENGVLVPGGFEK